MKVKEEGKEEDVMAEVMRYQNHNVNVIITKLRSFEDRDPLLVYMLGEVSWCLCF